MRRRAPVAVLLAAVLSAGCDSDDGPTPGAAGEPPAATAVPEPGVPPLPSPDDELGAGPLPEPAERPSDRSLPGPREALGARLSGATALRDAPAGRVVATVGRTTEFGSPRVLAVVERRGRWLGVLTDRRRGTLWIAASAARLVREPYAIEADLSDREVVVRLRGRVVRRIRVAVGSSATPTPPGRYAVTDGIRFDRRGVYGCCALALTGRQPDVPQGWTGGDRLAIHGTSNEATVGDAVSSGCLRAREADVRWLVANIPLGTIVRVRA